MRCARRRAAAAVAGLLVAPVVLGACSSSPSPVTAHGKLTVYDSPFSGLSMQDAYPDITDGSQVTVRNSSGTVIGTGTLSYSKDDTLVFLAQAEIKYPQIGSRLANYVDIYAFTVSRLPGGLARYGFTVGKNRGIIWVPASQVKDPSLSLGSLSS